MLHNEARKLLVQAYDKTHNVMEVAKYFSVNTSTVYRLLKRRNTTGSIETQPHLRGRKASLTQYDMDQINALVQEKPDITVNEIIDALGLPVCSETVRKALIKLGYVYKKKSMHATEQERPRCGAETQHMVRPFVWVQTNRSGLSG